MAAVDPSRLPTGRRAWIEFVAAIAQADITVERYFLELKSHIDLNSNHGRMKVVKFILGALNRDSERAARRFGGHALMVLGVDPPRGVVGTEPFEAKDLAELVRKFAGAPAARLWDFEYVESGTGRPVIVIIVHPPTGDVWTSLRDGDGLRDGGIYIRGDGETREAKGDEVRELMSRAIEVAGPRRADPRSLLDETRTLIAALNDEESFPLQDGSSRQSLPTVLDHTRRILDASASLTETAVDIGAVGQNDDPHAATRAINALSRAGLAERSGFDHLIQLRKLPAVLTLTAGVFGAVARQNAPMLAAFAAAPKVESRYLDQPIHVPLLLTPWSPFGTDYATSQFVIYGLAGGEVTDDVVNAHAQHRIPQRVTSASDILRHAFARSASRLVVDEQEFNDLFDVTESLIGAITLDLDPRTESEDRGAAEWVGGQSRSRGHQRVPVAERMSDELRINGSDWWPLRSGCFGASIERAQATLARYADLVKAARRRHY